jgi:hypothetical protein
LRHDHPNDSTTGIVERLTFLAAELIRMKDGPKFGGADVIVRVAEPDALIRALVESRALIESQQKEIADRDAELQRVRDRGNVLFEETAWQAGSIDSLTKDLEEARAALSETAKWIGPFMTIADLLDAEENDERVLTVKWAEGASARVGLHVLWHLRRSLSEAVAKAKGGI